AVTTGGGSRNRRRRSGAAIPAASAADAATLIAVDRRTSRASICWWEWLSREGRSGEANGAPAAAAPARLRPAVDRAQRLADRRRDLFHRHRLGGLRAFDLAAGAGGRRLRLDGAAGRAAAARRCDGRPLPAPAAAAPGRRRALPGARRA